MKTRCKFVNPSYILLIAALLFIIIGVVQGDFHDTMQKAVMICLECIGIG